MTAELYFSTDVETDGPIPGTDDYSMVSIGTSTPGYRRSDGTLVRLLSGPFEFYAELKPISAKWDPEALSVSGLNREDLIADGREPAEAMTALNQFIDSSTRALGIQIGETVRPVFAAYPLGFDWMFTYWYQMHFAGRSPFGHSTHIDMKSVFATKSGRGIVGATKRAMKPHGLLGAGEHTHNALDDAREQGDMLLNLLEWQGA